MLENDDDENIKMEPEYKKVEFLIITEPSSCPLLDISSFILEFDSTRVDQLLFLG